MKGLLIHLKSKLSIFEVLLIKWVTRSDKYELIDGHGKTVIFDPKQNEFVCIVGA